MQSSNNLPYSFSTNQFSIRVISTFGSKILNLGLITAANIIIARQLGPTGKGIVSICLLVPSLIATICHMGIGAANTYYGSKNELLVRRLLRNSLMYGVFLSIIIAIPYILFMPFYSGLLGNELTNQYLAICFCLFPLNLIWGYIGSIMLARQTIHELAIGRVLHNTIYLILVVVTIYFFKFEATAVLLAMLVAGLTEIFWDIHVIRNYLSLKMQPDFALLKKQFTYGIKGHVGNLFDFVNNRLDIFFVTYFLTVSQVGIYSISVLLAELIFYIPSAASTVLFPVTAASSNDQANRVTPVVCRHTFFWSVIAAVILFLIAKPTVEILFTVAFSNSILPLWLLLPGVVSLSINRVIANDFMGRGKPILNTYSAGIAALCTIILDIILIPLWGIPGAAIASSLAYFVSSTFIIFFFLRESECRFKELVIPTSDDLRYYSVRLKALFNFLMEKT